jgi:oxygen-independent coproporphyrinogen-3 oxidase
MNIDRIAGYLHRGHSMAGYYLHIPFCKQACIYCDFHFSTSIKGRKAILESMHREIEMRKEYLQDERLGSIYFGGGTPSLLEADDIAAFIQAIKERHEVENDAEITLEGNPDDLYREKIISLKEAGINRLSIGIQSFHKDDLEYLKRAHTADRALECIAEAQKAGFDNITIDLIYGIPGQTDEAWEENLKQVATFNIPHFSAYALTVEHKTELDYLIQKGKSKPVDEEQTARNFMALQRWAIENGYQPYEISNFAREGWIARHNTGYWTGMKYIGIGPSAHSFDGNSRQWNVSNNSLYSSKIEQGKPYFEKEMLTVEQQFEEYVMTGMRTAWGCSLKEIINRFGEKYARDVSRKIQKFVNAGNAEADENNIRLTIPGRLIADHIIAELF